MNYFGAMKFKSGLVDGSESRMELAPRGLAQPLLYLCTQLVLRHLATPDNAFNKPKTYTL